MGKQQKKRKNTHKHINKKAFNFSKMTTTSNSVIPNNFNAAVAHKRKERDLMKLLMSDYKVTQDKTNPYDFTVDFQGPKDSIYEGGQWEIHVLLPEHYPYKSPSI